MTDRLYFTDIDEANVLLVEDPFALLVGFALDQQVTVQKAFEGPLVLRERLGTLEAARVAPRRSRRSSASGPPSIVSPARWRERVNDLAAHIAERYDGDAARVWTDASTSEELKANLRRSPASAR